MGRAVAAITLLLGATRLRVPIPDLLLRVVQRRAAEASAVVAVAVVTTVAAEEAATLVVAEEVVTPVAAVAERTAVAVATNCIDKFCVTVRMARS